MAISTSRVFPWLHVSQLSFETSIIGSEQQQDTGGITVFFSRQPVCRRDPRNINPDLGRSSALLRAFLCSSRIALLLVAFLAPILVGAAERKSSESSTPVRPPPPVAIPLADIATRATEVSNLLGNLTTSAALTGQIEIIAKTLPELSEKLDTQFAATTKSLEAEPTLETLQNEQQQWQAAQLQTTGWLDALTLHATRLQDSLNQLIEWQKTWGSARASAQQAKAPGAILQQIDATLTAIAAAQAKVQSERTALLGLQSRVAQEVTKCGKALAQIGQFQKKAVAGILVPDAPPIWRVELWGDTLAVLSEHVRKAAVAHWADIVRYLREPHKGAAQHALLFVVLALVFSAARRKIDVWEKSGQSASSAILVFERPYAAALATMLVVATSPFFQMPTAVRQLLTVLVLVPLLRLMRPMVTVSFASAMYVFCFLFAIDLLRQAFASVHVAGQAILVAETLAAIIMLLWVRPYYRQEVTKNTASSHLNALKLARLLLTAVLIVALVAGVAGYARLARLLTPGVLVSVVLALAAFAYLRVSGGVVALALRVWPLSSLEMVAHHRELLERKVYRLLIWMAVMGWLVRYLSYLGLLDPAWSLAQALLATKLERGSIAVPIGNVLEFFLTVWLAYLLSRFLRFVLQEDVYPRIHLAPGLSYAASSLLNYIILALGFVAGIGVLGVDFSKVSIIQKHWSKRARATGARGGFLQGEHHGRRVRRRHRLRPARGGQQLRVRSDPALRAADSRR